MRLFDTKRIMTVLFVIETVAFRCWVLLCCSGLHNSALFEVDVQH